MRFSPLLLPSLLLLPGLASATSISYTGTLDPNNPNDSFLATLTLVAASDVVVQPYGYGGSANAPGGANAAGAVIAAGGSDTYLSLFQGTGPAATFLMSNDDGGCGPASPDPACADSRLSLSSLAAGSYTIALTLPNNFSLAEITAAVPWATASSTSRATTTTRRAVRCPAPRTPSISPIPRPPPSLPSLRLSCCSAGAW